MDIFFQTNKKKHKKWNKWNLRTFGWLCINSRCQRCPDLQNRERRYTVQAEASRRTPGPGNGLRPGLVSIVQPPGADTWAAEENNPQAGPDTAVCGQHLRSEVGCWNKRCGVMCWKPRFTGYYIAKGGAMRSRRTQLGSGCSRAGVFIPVGQCAHSRSTGSTIQYFIVPQGGISLAARATLRRNKTTIKSHNTVIYYH